MVPFGGLANLRLFSYGQKKSLDVDSELEGLSVEFEGLAAEFEGLAVELEEQMRNVEIL